MSKRCFYFCAFLHLLLSHQINAQTHNLSYYLEKGLANSPLLQDFRYQQQSNLIDSLKVYASYRPQVNATASAMEAPLTNHFGYDEAVTNGGDYSGVVRVSQDLFNRRARTVQLENIRLLNLSLAAQRRLEAQDLKRLITAQYITTYADYRQMQFSEQVLGILQEEEPALRKLVQNGVYLQTDYLNLTINLKAQAIAYRQARIQYRFDLNGLRILCGIVDTGMVELQPPEIAVQDLLTATPTLLKYKVDSLQLALNRRQIDLNYRYKLSAFADAGIMATTPRGMPQHVGASAGLSFSVPIYDGGQRRLEYQKIAIAQQSREKYRDFYLNQYRMFRRQLSEQLAATNQLIQDIQEQLESQQKLLKMYRIELAAGLVRFTDYILVITNYAEMQNNLVQAEINRFQIVNEYNNLK